MPRITLTHSGPDYNVTLPAKRAPPLAHWAPPPSPVGVRNATALALTRGPRILVPITATLRMVLGLHLWSMKDLRGTGTPDRGPVALPCQVRSLRQRGSFPCYMQSLPCRSSPLHEAFHASGGPYHARHYAPLYLTIIRSPFLMNPAPQTIFLSPYRCLPK